MNITEITKLAGRDRRRRRLGRGKGSGRGGTSGRGDNGARSRAGFGGHVLREGGQMPTFRRMPKRGFNNALFTTRYSIVNVSSLEERFDAGTHITPQVMVEAGLIRNLRLPVKVLGNGALSKKFVVDAAKFSGSALEKIKAAGGEARTGSGKGATAKASE